MAEPPQLQPPASSPRIRRSEYPIVEGEYPPSLYVANALAIIKIAGVYFVAGLLVWLVAIKHPADDRSRAEFMRHLDEGLYFNAENNKKEAAAVQAELQATRASVEAVRRDVGELRKAVGRPAPKGG